MKKKSTQKKSRNLRARSANSKADILSLSRPFRVASIVLITLNNPREKFWGAILDLNPAGVSLQGIELSSFEDATNMFIAGELLPAAALFFPMHRVERIQLDLPEGTIPSLSQRFTNRTGVSPAEALARATSRANSASGDTAR